MTIPLNHMTKQSSHISHDCPTESHDLTELTHTIRKEKFKHMARIIYILSVKSSMMGLMGDLNKKSLFVTHSGTL